MKERINVAELLKDCPKGMELDCTMFDNVTFVGVNNSRQFPIETAIGGRHSKYLTKEGCFHDTTLLPEAKCVIFPKGKTTWEGFQRPFKDGDVLFVDCSDKKYKASKYIFILNKSNFYGEWHSYCHLDGVGNFYSKETYLTDKEYNPRLATEEEKQKLFKAIKDNGYKWNTETKTLEKLIVPKFKVGDMIKLKNTPTNNILTVTKTNDDGSLNVNMYSWVIKYELQDEYELVLNNQPKFKVGDKIKKKGEARLISIKDVRDDCYIITFPDYFGHCYITDKLSFSNQGDYELTPNKFDITTLKAFDKVLVRDESLLEDSEITDATWSAALYSHNKFVDNVCPYVTTNGHFAQCVPYKGNEHLLGTTDDCDEYYKTWE